SLYDEMCIFHCHVKFFADKSIEKAMPMTPPAPTTKDNGSSITCSSLTSMTESAVESPSESSSS
ncbi:hypothetical protein ACHAW6_004183, partial [Cyclotella cf. meneghiniana]